MNKGFSSGGAGRFVRWSSTPLSKHFSEPKWLNSGEEVIRNPIKLAIKQPLKSKINLEFFCCKPGFLKKWIDYFTIISVISVKVIEVNKH